MSTRYQLHAADNEGDNDSGGSPHFFNVSMHGKEATALMTSITNVPTISN